MLSQILTILNILGSLFAIYKLIRIATDYLIGPRMANYIFLSIVGLMIVIFWQLYYLVLIRTERPGPDFVIWIYRLPVTIIWLTKLYFAWAIKFSLIKKT